MKRILIMSGAEEFNKSSNSQVEEMFNLTVHSKQKYAQIHGYDINIVRNFGNDEKNKLQRSDRNVGFLRFLRVAEMMNYYDTVMWIDGDSLVTNTDYSINDFELDENTTFYASWDWMHKTPYFNGHYYHAFSLGNFILQRTKQLDEFLNLFFSVANQFPEEQYTLNTIYAKTEFRNTFKVLDHKFLGGVPKQVELLEIWKNRSKLAEPWSKDHFLCHFTGISNQDRIDLMKTHFKEYL